MANNKNVNKNIRAPWKFENPLCSQVGGEMFFSADLDDPTELDSNMSNVQEARKICGRCDHQIECAEWGIRHERFGVWGGYVSKELVSIRRKRKIILNAPVSFFVDK